MFYSKFNESFLSIPLYAEFWVSMVQLLCMFYFALDALSCTLSLSVVYMYITL